MPKFDDTFSFVLLSSQFTFVLFFFQMHNFNMHQIYIMSSYIISVSRKDKKNNCDFWMEGVLSLMTRLTYFVKIFAADQVSG